VHGNINKSEMSSTVGMIYGNNCEK